MCNVACAYRYGGDGRCCGVGVDIESGDLPVIIDGIRVIVGSEVIGGRENG